MSFSDDDNYYDINDTFKLPDKNPYNIGRQVILVAMASLAIVILVVQVVALHFCAWCVLRRRRAAATFHGLDLTGNRVHEPPKGLDPTVIASLPLVKVKQTDGQDHDTTTTTIECAVCLGELEEQEMARLLPNCKHIFHAECIDKWLASHSTCPICRTETEPPMLQPEPQEGPAEANQEGPAGQVASVPPLDLALSSSRLNSFLRMLSRDQPSRRLQEDHSIDLERQ